MVRIKEKPVKNKKFRRQQSIRNYIVDFYCPEEEFVIELDGEQHTEDKIIKYDNERTKYLEGLGLKVIRFRNTEVLFERDRVVKEILKKLSGG